jgi:hypothetical protein
MSEPVDDDLRRTVTIALRHFDVPSTTEQERDSVLRTAAKFLDSAVAERAARALHHREEARTQQLEMRALLDGIGRPPPAANN